MKNCYWLVFICYSPWYMSMLITIQSVKANNFFNKPVGTDELGAHRVQYVLGHAEIKRTEIKLIYSPNMVTADIHYLMFIISTSTTSKCMKIVYLKKDNVIRHSAMMSRRPSQVFAVDRRFLRQVFGLTKDEYDCVWFNHFYYRFNLFT